MNLRSALVITFAMLLAVPASAEIWAWQDADGVRRFTNQAELIPEEFRDQARVIVAAMTSSTTDEQPDDQQRRKKSVAAEKPPRRQAQVVYDRPPPSEEYLRGVSEGMNLARERDRFDEQTSYSPVVISPPFVPPPWYYPQPLYQAPVATGFDRGRSRHRTLRMRLQEQFQDERYPDLAPWEVGYLNGIPYPNWTRHVSRPSKDPWRGKRYYLQ